MEVMTTEVTEETAAAPGTTIYTVRRGDTLSEIAARAGTSVSRIKNLNNMTGDRIRIGQKLIVPGEIVVVEEESTLDVVDYNPAEYTAVHVVDRGETPSGIANRYGMSTTELLAVNGITDARLLRAGSELKVKPAATGSKSSVSPSGASLLQPREDTSSEPSGEEEEADSGSDEGQPVAPEIVPREPTPVESEPIEDEEGFGAEIFEDFEGFEEVPVDRRSADEG